MLPADGLQGAPAIGNVDRFMTDLAKIPRAITAEYLEQLIGARGTRESADGGIRGSFIPIIHGLDECLLRLLRRGHFGFIRRSHGPVAFTDILGLRRFEIIERPKNRQPAVGIGR